MTLNTKKNCVVTLCEPQKKKKKACAVCWSSLTSFLPCSWSYHLILGLLLNCANNYLKDKYVVGNKLTFWFSVCK